MINRRAARFRFLSAVLALSVGFLWLAFLPAQSLAQVETAVTPGYEYTYGQTARFMATWPAEEGFS